MRVLKFLLMGIAVVFTLAVGLVAACFAAALALLVHLARRLGRQPAAPRSATNPPPRTPRAAHDDAIDITATEVRPDPPAR